MALCMYFPVKGMTVARYEGVLRDLEAAGQGAPAGRSYHCAFFAGDDLHVVDVWDSQEAFDAFGEVLIPILTANGVEPAQPEAGEVHNIIAG